MDERQRLIRLANESRTRGDLSAWGRYMSAARWGREDLISDISVFRYSKASTYSSTRHGTKEARIWIYENDSREYSPGQLEDVFINFLLSLSLRQSRLQDAMESAQDSAEISAEVSANAVGHSVGLFYGYFTFISPSGEKQTFFKTSRNGRTWSSSGPFNTKLPGRISRRELQRAVERRVYPKPKELKMVKPKILTAIEGQKYIQLGKLAAKYKTAGKGREWAVTMNKIRWAKVREAKE